MLRLLAEGLSNHDIGRALFIETTTVKSHVAHVLTKLDVTSRVQAALWWHRHAELP
ncbi:response regulator transcription factor [Devriesea agamarum]|uniref:response regulator transcription factor n=1 Tax=Devriesea agamarum TaxID=472569 RepID=UPI001E5A1D08|nr:LuxR C-terminal-related transcriptional regulator [Devriesea agamarum]